ncbi:hypothetical protein BJP36_37755 [Moorena producens JHB]|uniref:Uncharacterized protein n=1 Tax=Moorena producens (strain JHB) TaxID=1454205 RepID=A0A9Q9UWH0_MOOP1|nr:hypothetical protein [Moorena producens]WAN69841.1 hypothetical protein BJP36_37755 [Moorena producens JHB]
MVSVERVGSKSSAVVCTISDCVNIGIVRLFVIGMRSHFPITNNLTLEQAEEFSLQSILYGITYKCDRIFLCDLLLRIV